MKKITLIMMILPFLMSCSSESNTSKNNIAVVEKYITAVEELDYATMESLLADSYQGLGPSYGDSINKEQALASWKYNVDNLYAGIKYSRLQNASVKIIDGPNKGDWVSSWAELKITYKNGDHAIIWANTAYKVEEGKIIKTFTFYNEADVYRQLGYGFVDFKNL